jgi:Tfp pilus assembly protein PilW
MTRSASERLRDESSGFTLVELLVASVVAMVVLGAAVMGFTATAHQEPRVDTAANAIAQARATVERIVRELRQASGVVPGTTPTASQLSIVTYVHSTCAGAGSTTATQCSVTYSCASGVCTRRVALLTGASPGPAVQVVSGLSSSNVFSCSPSCSAPTYIGVTLAFPDQTGGNAITLSDGADLRNLGG